MAGGLLLFWGHSDTVLTCSPRVCLQSSGGAWPSAFCPVESVSVGEGLLGAAVPFPPFSDLPKGRQGHRVLRETGGWGLLFNKKYDKEKHKQENSCDL